MELDPSEITKIDGMIARWLPRDKSGKEQELEATFGQGSQVDATTFIAIAKRLQEKGFESRQEEDRLSIITQKNIRISLQGIGVLERYCKENRLEEIGEQPFTALRKKNTNENDTLDIAEYSLRIKSRMEESIDRSHPELQELLRNWLREPKAFRLIKRWSFFNKGMRIDMSIIRSSPKNSQGEFLWKTKFLDPYNKKGETIFQQPVHYEVEVELLHNENTDTAESAKKYLIGGIGEVLRAIQGNTLLIRNSVETRVLKSYTALNKNNPKFRGVPPVTMEVKNMEPLTGSIPNIRRNYNVTDKADGLRAHGFVDKDGEFYLIDMAMRVYRTGYKNMACANSLMDGEWVKRSKDNKAINQYYIFDVYYMENEDVSTYPFATFDEGATYPNEDDDKSRYGLMRKWMKYWNDKDSLVLTPIVRNLPELTRLNVSMKTFRFASPTKPDEIFDVCKETLQTEYLYHTDGLILTPNALPLPRIGDTFYEQFKWKPAADNTIDFLVVIEPGTKIGFDADNRESRFKELRLFVNGRKDPAYDDPRKTILNMLPLPERLEGRGGKKPIIYQPSQFIPEEYPDSMASICYLNVKQNLLTGEEYVVTEDDEPISNKSIVEMRYDPANAPGRRWIPMRIRHDKTERFAKAMAMKRGNLKQTLNSEPVANSVWNSIHNPITVSMISTGSIAPSAEELRKAEESRYYNRQASKDDLGLISGLRAFHNHYIKRVVLYGSVLKEPGKKILDLACGQAGDIGIWTEKRAAAVVGIDQAIEGLREKKNGAYARYMNFLIQRGKENVPRMIFLHGDSGKTLADGSAALSIGEGDMMKVVLGTGFGKVPPYVAKEPNEGGVRGILKEHADVASCMFALHYFFKNKETLDGFLQNLQDNVKVGGHFIACFTDGERVFQMLKGKEVEVGVEKGVNLWSIRKKYDAEELPTDDSCLGMAVDIKFISLGEEVHTEYLVPYPYLIKRLNAIGFELLTGEELTKAGLQNSTNTFDRSFDMVKKDTRFEMLADVKKYSFTNRWIIVRRRGAPVVRADVDEFGGSVVSSVKPGSSDAASLAAQESKVIGSKEEKKGKGKEEEDEEWGGGGSDKPENIFLFGPEVSITANVLGKEDDKFYPRKLSPIWQFTLKEEGGEVDYPSLEHFWAAMKILHAGQGSKKSLEAAAAALASNGSIHEEAKERLLKEVKPKHAISTQNMARMKIYLEEYNKIRDMASKVLYDDSKWASVRDKYIRYGLEQRWKHDAEFHKTVEELRLRNSYLLYSIGPHIGDPTGALAGKVKKDGTVEGENLIGKTIMELAKFRV